MAQMERPPVTKKEIKEKIIDALIESAKDQESLKTGILFHYILDSLLADREELLWACSRLPFAIKEKVQAASENRIAKIVGTLQ